MPSWVARVFERVQAYNVPWRNVLRAVIWLTTMGWKYFLRLTTEERKEFLELVLKWKGKRSNLSRKERDRLVALWQKMRGPEEKKRGRKWFKAPRFE